MTGPKNQRTRTRMKHLGGDLVATYEEPIHTRSSGGNTRSYLVRRLQPHLPPWLGVAGVGVVGALGNWRW
ncbi:hypothetical protein D3C59_36820, partial [Streptomyces sp. SHP22-7]